jgi:transcriptional regulator
MFQGPHSYISPSWYASQESVPTWNYTVVHAYGRPRMLDRAGHYLAEGSCPPEREIVRAALDFDTQAAWIEKLLPQIAFEIPIERLEGKFKLNQNRTLADRKRVVEVLSASQDPAQRHMAELMQQAEQSKPRR